MKSKPSAAKGAISCAAVSRWPSPERLESAEPPRITVIGEQIGVLNKVDHALAARIAERVIARYSEGSIDAVYLIFNEFKSVIQQRLVVERVLAHY